MKLFVPIPGSEPTAVRHNGAMHFGGILPEDAPDPKTEREEMLRLMPIPIVELAEQDTLEGSDISVNTGTDADGYFTVTATTSSTLWRNPHDKSDPVNLANLDEATLRSIEQVPPWPRPAWLIEQVERMKYPSLWEAVKTTWNREESEYTTLLHLLSSHANYILINQFRQELGLGVNDWDSPALTSINSVRPGVSLSIGGDTVIGAEIDTDPFVYAIGADLPAGGTLTAVVSREHLPYIKLEFALRR